MFIKNVLHLVTGGVHHLLSFASFFTDSQRASPSFACSFLLLYMSLLTVHLCTTAALSVDVNLAGQSAATQTTDHYFPERKRRSAGEAEAWTVDDWWHATLVEDRLQKARNDEASARWLHPLRRSHGRSFEPQSAENEWTFTEQRDGTQESRSAPQMRVEELFDEEDGIDTAESFPQKRRWPPANTVHFPLYPRVETGDLDSAESTERKTSTGGK